MSDTKSHSNGPILIFMLTHHLQSAYIPSRTNTFTGVMIDPMLGPATLIEEIFRGEIIITTDLQCVSLRILDKNSKVITSRRAEMIGIQFQCDFLKHAFLRKFLNNFDIGHIAALVREREIK